MIWINFPLYAWLTIFLWCCSSFFFLKNKDKNKIPKLAVLFLFAGLIFMASFMAQFWLKLERPPLRTLGETRLWYCIFLPLTAVITLKRWPYKWLPVYCLALASMFLIINLMNPDTYNKALMPALQSPWFVPHVMVYILSYSVLGASCAVALRGLYLHYFRKDEDLSPILNCADDLVQAGFAFLTCGICFGAIWAKEAWGHYWAWDPKETWAFITWLSYLIYIHFRSQKRLSNFKGLLILSVSFLILLFCWFGIKYLPAAQVSVHTYSEQP